MVTRYRRVKHTTYNSGGGSGLGTILIIAGVAIGAWLLLGGSAAVSAATGDSGAAFKSALEAALAKLRAAVQNVIPATGATPSTAATSAQAALQEFIAGFDASVASLGGLYPGTYQEYPGGPVQSGYGLGGLFVVDQPGSYPFGPVIISNVQLSTAEQTQVLQNLANTGIVDAWWNAGSLIAEQQSIASGQIPNQQGHYVCQNKEGWDYAPC